MSNAENCKMHLVGRELRLMRASKQYMYDDTGTEYLDCISSAAHVGHCHPHVVSRGQQQMARLVWAQGFLFDALSLYLKALTDMMPDQLSVCYLVNSGSEANDLALRLAKTYTRREDVIVLEGAYHGNLGSVADISPKLFDRRTGGNTGSQAVHVAPLPDTYRGRHREDDPQAGAKYASGVQGILDNLEARHRSPAAFISEGIVTTCGIVTPPEDYFKRVYSMVRSHGGLCIMDEVQTGLGRIGSHLWTFEAYGVVPDILTLGKPLGNGHPMAAVITRREVADSMSEYYSTFGGNPVSCTIGLAVLEVMRNENVMTAASNVGKHLLDGLTQLMLKHDCIGDVRGRGLCLGVDIVSNRESRKPDRALARSICLRLRGRRVLMSTIGTHDNVLQLTPPMCFTMSNVRTLIASLDSVLHDLERGVEDPEVDRLWQSSDFMDAESVLTADEDPLANSHAVSSAKARDLMETGTAVAEKTGEVRSHSPDDAGENEVAPKRSRLYEEVD